MLSHENIFFQVTADGIQYNAFDIWHSAAVTTYVSVTEVMCRITSTLTSNENSYIISVSNDGKDRDDFNEAQLFVVINPDCHKCDLALPACTIRVRNRIYITLW